MRTTYLDELACLLVILFVALLVLAYVDLNDSCLHKLQMNHNRSVQPRKLCDDLIEAIEVLQRLWEQSGAKLKLANLREPRETKMQSGCSKKSKIMQNPKLPLWHTVAHCQVCQLSP